MENISPSPLRSFGALFIIAWKTFNQYFQTLFGITLIGLLPQVVLSAPTTADAPMTPIMFALGVIAIFLALWMSAALYYFVVKKPAEKNPLKIYGLVLRSIWRFFTTSLIEGILYFVIVLTIAILGFFILGFNSASLLSGNPATNFSENTIAFVLTAIIVLFVALIPIIWLSIRWQFSSLLVITDGIANFAALRQSAQLVKGRWWSIFGRMFLFGISTLGYFIVVGIITSLFGENVVVWGLQTLLTGLVTGPLFICFEVELFSDLRPSTPPPTAPLTPQPMVTT